MKSKCSGEHRLFCFKDTEIVEQTASEILNQATICLGSRRYRTTMGCCFMILDFGDCLDMHWETGS
jgi:hypothetical protein